MPFCHLMKYYKSKPSTIIAKAEKVSANTTGNNLWEEATKTELKQLTDYHTFKVIGSGESIPTDNQKIPYHMMFYVKYDLRNKARLVAGSNLTVN
jgi:hypothetical protein